MTATGTGFRDPVAEGGERDSAALLTELAASARAKAAECAALQQATLTASADKIAACGAAMARRFAAGGRLWSFGNGGSATDGATFAALFANPPGDGERRRGRPARSLAADPAVLTALGHDVGFDLAFSRQIAAHAGPDDIAVAFCASGSPRNLMTALREACDRGLLTIGFAGHDSGEMASSAAVEVCFAVGSLSVYRIQESQALLGYQLWAAAVHPRTGAGQ